MRKTLDDMTPEECGFTITWRTKPTPGMDAETKHTDFVLREMTCENHVVEYTKHVIMANQSHEDTLKPLVAATAVEKNMKATECFFKGQAELVAWLLSTVPENPQPKAHPLKVEEDDRGRSIEVPDTNLPATFVEWVKQNISFKMRVKITDGQNELNGQANISGNVNMLLQNAGLGVASDKMMAQNVALLEEVQKALKDAAVAKEQEEAREARGETSPGILPVVNMNPVNPANPPATAPIPNRGTKPARDIKRGREARI